MSQLIGDSIYISGSPSVQELYGTYNSKADGVAAVRVGVYKSVPKGLRFGVITTNGFEEYLYVGPVVLKANVAESDFVKVYPIDEATTATAGLLSATDKSKVNQLEAVLQAGGWNVDNNYQVGGTGGGTSTIPADLNKRLLRIESILGDLYDDDDATGASDAYIIIQGDEDNGVSNS